jgi:hypothetical protein
MKLQILLLYLLAIISLADDELLQKEDNNTFADNLLYISKEHIGLDYWEYECKNISSGKERLSYDKKVLFCAYEPKCNLFVYEMLTRSGAQISLPNSMGNICKLEKALSFSIPTERPPTAGQWFNGEVENTQLIGENDEGLEKSNVGDIITDGGHVGIISGYNKTISAGCQKIIENDFGWRGEKDVRVYRYDSSKVIKVDFLDSSAIIFLSFRKLIISIFLILLSL